MQNLERMTLRERVTASHRLGRELVEHLEQGFIPKAHQLRRATRSSAEHDRGPGDRAVHAEAAEVLLSDDYTLGLYQQLVSHCESVRSSLQEMADS